MNFVINYRVSYIFNFSEIISKIIKKYIGNG